MNSTEKTIGVVPIGDIPEMVSSTVAAHILGYLGVNADILPPLEEPEYAYDERRLQYNAMLILKALEQEFFSDYAKIIGILDVDVFVPLFIHVFGEAKQGGRSALVSLHRLKKDQKGSTPPQALVLERTAKVALHEIGHLFNLVHCTDEKCLMHFSGVLLDLDRTPLYFCRYCSTYFRDVLQR